MRRVKERGKSSGRGWRVQRSCGTAVLGAIVGVGYANRIGANNETEVVEAGLGLKRQIQRDLKATWRCLASTRTEKPNLVPQCMAMPGQPTEPLCVSPAQCRKDLELGVT